MKNSFILFLLFIIALLSGCSLTPVETGPLPRDEGDNSQISLGEEYSDYSRTGVGSRGESSESIPEALFFYLPNRLLDFIDIIRADVGVGPTTGAVVRVTKYGQFGARFVSPFSLRAGLAGRRSPVFLESSSEFGIASAYVESRDRVVEPVEIGAGLDLILVGAYLGVNFTEIPDFLAGFFFFDPSEDDY